MFGETKWKVILILEKNKMKKVYLETPEAVIKALKVR